MALRITVATVRYIACRGFPAAPASARREYIPVNYGTLTEVQALVKQFVPDAQIITDSRLNLLIVEGTDSDIEQVEEVLLEPFVEELARHTDSQNVVFKLNGHYGFKPSFEHLLVLCSKVRFDNFKTV